MGSQVHGHDIAVVGMSCRLPGARHIDEYWRNLCAGVESITFFSKDELVAAGIAADVVEDPAYIGAHGVLQEAYCFDAAFFGVSPREAEVLDPQHRVFLECAASALEESACDPVRFPGQIGVFAGCGSSSYSMRLFNHPEVIASVGIRVAQLANGKDFLTTRVSHRLGLRGPSIAVQTACSTSLVAVHLACQSLYSLESDLALAGGVNIPASQVLGYRYQEGGIRSRDGHCRPFDACASGTVGGSGVGVVVLKRLADALRDRDTIHAVIKATAVNNDGDSKIGFTAPSITGQARVIAEALATADVDPAAVSYVEAHGTGTALGDPIEVAALSDVFTGSTARTNRCLLGAVKSNIGHLDCAAGIAGLIKTVLVLKHRCVPPTLHFGQANPETALEMSPFHVNTELVELRANGTPLRACVSSFGLGGTNAHAVLEEAPVVADGPPDDRPQLLILSARTGSALHTMRRNLLDHLTEHPDLSLADVAATLQDGRTGHPLRWSAVARDIEELRAALTGDPPPRVDAQSMAQRDAPVAFLFPGQGTQFAGMARELYDGQPVFRREFDCCADAVCRDLALDLRSIVFPADSDRESANARLRQTRYTQPALFAVEYALARLWMSWGVQPEAMIGHSVGEYVAACLAGVFSLDSALRLVVMRGRLMHDLPEGAMLAVPLSEADTRSFLSVGLFLAAVNSPMNCVVAGEVVEIGRLHERLEGIGIAARRLHTSHAFHSAAVDPILDAFANEVRQVRTAAPTIPLLSNVTGDWVSGDQLSDPDYWVRHMRHTVRFGDGMRRLLEDPKRVLLEVGPGETLGVFARRQARDDHRRTIAASLPITDHSVPSDVAMLDAVGLLWRAGVAIDWSSMRGGIVRRRLSLPTYPFERTEYHINRTHAPSVTAPPDGGVTAATAMTQSTAAVESMSRPRDVLNTTSAPRLSRLVESLATLFARLLGIDATQIDQTTHFVELGADSLLLMQAGRSIESTFGVRVPFRQLLEGLSTVERLAAHLDGELPEELEAPDAALGTPAVPRALDAPAAPLQQQVLPYDPACKAVLHRQPAATSPLQGIFDQQLAIMRAQLELLRGGTVPATGTCAGSDETTAAPPTPVLTKTAPSHTACAERSLAHGPHRPVSESISEGGGLTPRQARHFDDLVRRYTGRTALSKAYAAANRQVLADNRASLHFRMATKELVYPIVAERSQDARMWDVDGNEYIDFTLGFGVHMFGHQPPFIVHAVEEQIARGVHLGPQSDLAGPVAAMFHELTGMERVTFCNTGSEAVMTALRIARTATGRNTVAIFRGSYHGGFDGVLARPRSSDRRDWRSRPVSLGTPQAMVDDVMVLPYGTADALEWLRSHASDLAAVLVEPVQASNLDFQPREFLSELRQLTRRSGIVLIFDEMITGLRLQSRGAQGWFGIDADLATYGKVVGGGFPLGVVAGRATLMDTIDGGYWTYGDDSHPTAAQTFFAGTFCKHPVAMAAAAAVLRHLKDEGPALYDRLNSRTERLVSAMQTVIAEEEAPIAIPHCGSVFRFQCKPRDRVADFLFYHLLERGIYVWEGRSCFVSTAHTEQDCDRFVAAFRQSLHALREGGFLSESPRNVHTRPRPTIDGDAIAAADAPTDSSEQSSHSDIVPSFPLTPAQRQIWIHSQLGEDASRAYHEQKVFELFGPFDTEAMRAAVSDLVLQHEALRTVFDESGQFQSAQPSLPAHCDVTDIVLDAQAYTEALATAARETFDLCAGPLLRVHVYLRGHDHFAVQLVVHHIVCDAIGMAALFRDLEAAYDARRSGRVPTFPASMQYSEYAALLRGASERMADREVGWLAQFNGSTPLVLPTDRPRSLLISNTAATSRLTLSSALVLRLKDCSRRNGRTVLMTLLGGWLLTMHRIADQHDLLVGISSANRPFPGSDSMVGNCVDVLPIRSRVNAATRVGSFLEQVRASLLNAYEHDVFSYAQLSTKINVPRGQGIPPLISVTFNLEPPRRDRGRTGRFADLRLEPVPKSGGFAKFDVAVDAIDVGDEMLIECTFNADLFDRATIDRQLSCFSRILEQIADGVDVPVFELSLLNAEERRLIVDRWNDTALPYPGDRCIHELFEEQVARTPNAVAVTFGTCALSYAELDARANQLAHMLRAMLIGPEARVGIRLERSLELMIALLGVMKAGAAYVPMDPAYPSERCAYILEDAGASVLLTQQNLLDDWSVPRGVTVVSIDEPTTRLALGDQLVNTPKTRVTPENLAYVIYTSGSTGRPKGVAMHHRGVSNYLDWGVRAYGAASGHGAPVFTSMAVDLTITNLLPLFTGRTVHLLPEDNPVEALAEVLRNHPGFGPVKITPLHLSLLTPYLDAEDARAATHTLVVGADFLPAEPTIFWQDHAPQVRLMNEYGPTETVVGCSAYTLPPGRHRQGAVPVGGPIQNLRFYVLDPGLQPVPIGVPGELYIGGTGVARGYLGRPGITAERFVPDPFGEPGARFYRTGDRACWLEDANLLILGRTDHQVKIRGYRVELEEIEAVLRQCPAVSQCVVIARTDQAGERRLIAYVVGDVDAQTLRRHAQRILPDYMVPNAFVLLQALPETPTGKLDRNALPAPEFTSQESYVAPTTPEEIALSGIWRELLRVERVGVTDNFFALGGDSILAIQIATRARRMGLHVRPRQLFEHQTIAELAAAAGTVAADAAASHPRPDGPVPLTPIQAWFFEQSLARPSHYNQSVIWDIDSTLSNSRLEEALQLVIGQHDALRLRFRRRASLWEQWHVSNAGIALERVDISALPEDEQRQLQEDMIDQRHASLDLERGPVARAVLFDAGARGRQLLVILHHLVVDSVSWRTLREDLERTCAQMEAGTVVDLGPKSASFQQWAVALSRYAASGGVLDELAYWTSKPIPRLPVDGEHESIEADSRTVTVHLNEAETRALLQELHITYDVRAHDAFLYALAEALSAWTNSAQVAVTLESHGRQEDLDTTLDLTRTVGWFTSAYPIVLDVERGGSVGDRLSRITQQLEAVPRQGVGYGILRYLSPDDNVRRALVASGDPELSFNYLGHVDAGIGPDARFRLAGGRRRRRSAPVNRRTHRLEVNVGISGGCLHASWTYGERVYCPDTIERLAASFLTALLELLPQSRRLASGRRTHPDFPLAALEPAELETVLAGRADIDDLYPLAPMQEGMLFHALSAPTTQAYQVQIVQHLEGALDVALFRRVWDDIVQRYAVLRTAFMWEGLRRPLQSVHATAQASWVIEDWRDRSPDEQEAGLQRYVSEQNARGFALHKPPLARWALFRVDEQRYRFVWHLHHLILDGWSVSRILGEVTRLYQGWSAGAVVQRDQARPWREYIAWLQQQDPAAAERYWRMALAGFTAPTPLGIGAPAGRAEPRYARETIDVSEEQRHRLEALARQMRVTMNTIVLGAWGLLLSRYGGVEDVVFGTTTSGRPAAIDGVDDMIGMFINTVPVRVSVPPDARLSTWLRELQDSQLDARDYEYASLLQIHGWSEMARGTPLFESHVIFENYPMRSRAVTSQLQMRGSQGVEWSTVPLSLTAAPGQRFLLHLSYDQNRFEHADINRALRHFVHILDEMAASPDCHLSDISVLSRAEQGNLRMSWHASLDGGNDGTGVTMRIAGHAARTPDAVAVTHGSRRITYAELEREAVDVGARLQQAGVKPGEPVLVMTDDRVRMVTALLGVWKAAGAFVPMLPELPDARIQALVMQIKPRVALVDAALAERLTRLCKGFGLDSTIRFQAVGDGSDANITAESRWPTPEQVAYIVFTSGSTGAAKPIAGRLAGVEHFIHWELATFAVGETVRGSQLISPMFDAYLRDVLVPLCAGGTLCVPPDPHVVVDGRAFTRWLAETRITLVHTVPSIFRGLLGAESIPLPSVTHVLLSGEPLLPVDVRKWRALHGETTTLVNLYGPSETTMTKFVHVVTAADVEARAVPIGKPMPGAQAVLLNARGQVCPLGTVGEVYIRTPYRTLGYYERPDLTAASFVANPVTGDATDLVYRTGDLARLRPDGTYQLVGRADGQVKIRGVRIEPQEIEAALLTCEGVTQASVIDRDDASGARILCAYVVLQPGVVISTVREQLQRLLPENMVPNAFVQLDQIPRTPNGKIDRPALASLAHGVSDAPRGSAPHGPVQEALAAIWTDVLRVPRVSAGDDFFALGGHSLMVMVLVSRINAAFGVDFPIVTAFDARTLESMSAELERMICDTVVALPESEVESGWLMTDSPTSN